jgi:hypothetical protein
MKVRGLLLWMLLFVGFCAIPSPGATISVTSPPTASLLGKGKTFPPDCVQKINSICQTGLCFTAKMNYMTPVGFLRWQEFQRTGEWLSHEDAVKLCRQKNG